MQRQNAVVVAKMALAVVATLVAAQLSACAGGVDEAGRTASPTGPSEQSSYRWPLHATVTLTAAGPDPASISINVGGRVTFVNTDARPHQIVSDPYLRHEECPAINRVGLLAPGQQHDSAVFEAVRSCGYHDHLDPTGVTGRIEVRIE
jgi:plastocyanin